MSKSKKITVVGAGYVGMSLAALLSKDHQVTILEIDNKKVSLINNNISTVEDVDIELFLSTQSLNLHATTDTKSALSKSEIILIAIPTNFDSSIDQFNTVGIEQIIDEIHQYFDLLAQEKQSSQNRCILHKWQWHLHPLKLLMLHCF